MMTEADDFAAYLSAEAKSKIAVFHEFRIQYYADDTSFHVFFEGEEDPLFYMARIRQVCKTHAHWYYCGGKPRLRELRDDVYEIVDKKQRITFFVDRDYDDLLATQIRIDSQTYVTDFYSVENYLVSPQALSILLVDFAGMSTIDPDYSLTISKYNRAEDLFAQEMKPFVAWILAARANKVKINLSNIDLSKIFEIKSSGEIIKKKQAFHYFKKACGAQQQACKIQGIRGWQRRLDGIERHLWLRGKFVYWFFRKFLSEYLKQELKVPPKKRWKMPKPLTNNTLFEALGPRIQHSATLQSFLSATYNQNEVTTAPASP